MALVADLSHWVNVAETSPDDPDLTAVIERLAGQFHHTHCRVGYDHGPQVHYQSGKESLNPGKMFSFC